MRGRSFLVAVMLFAGFCRAEERVHSPSGFKGHLQGIVCDSSGNIFWSYTTVLLKTDKQGKELARVDVPTHYGDLTLHDDRVYVAVNLGKFNREPGEADSWVYVHDAKTLELISKHAVPEAVHGAGGMEWHDNRFFVVGGLPATHEQNYVYEYDAEFKFIKRHVIESGQTLLGIQTVCRGSDGVWWFGCYGKPAVVLRTDDSFKLLGKHKFDAAVGIYRTQDSQVMLVARSTHSKEKLYGGWVAEFPVSKITGAEE